MIVEKHIAVIIPNWNGQDFIADCIDSLLAQSLRPTIVVVENGSSDNSRVILDSYDDALIVLAEGHNHGFAEGVNIGIRYALKENFDYVALLNNDAIADHRWVEQLAGMLDKHPDTAIVTSRITSQDGARLDSTGDFYTRWGLPYPRGRGELSAKNYMVAEEVFGASGGASMYRSTALRDFGLFDKKFFAYFEDVDISYRARIYGWRIYYCPDAIVYHRISATSTKIKGFTVYQTFKNYPLVFIKNTPLTLLITSIFFTSMAYIGLLVNSIKKGNGIFALKGFGAAILLFPHAISHRFVIQRNRRVKTSELKNWITFSVPSDQTGIIRLKKLFKV